jgi:hypothetical protein
MLQLFGRLHSKQYNPVERASGSLLSAEEDVAQIAVPREAQDGRYHIISWVSGYLVHFRPKGKIPANTKRGKKEELPRNRLSCL